MRPDGSIQSLPTPDLSTATKEDVLAFFDNGWLITEVLFSGACLGTSLVLFSGVCRCTVAPVMFGNPLLNNALTFDHVQVQK